MSFDSLKIALQYAMPKTALSRLVGKFASAKAGAVTTFAIKRFIKSYNIDMSEAKLENAEDFATFNDFFTRELKDGLRPISADSKEICFPVDGTISQQGDIVNNQIIQAKGFNYSLETLLGGDANTAAPFQGGKFSTIYLAPKDYHRIHMPIAGTLREMIFVPGDLFSVNPLTAENVPNLFARNERVVTIFDTEIGPIALVLVGATIVASIETVWAGTIAPSGGKALQRWHYPAAGEPGAITLEKGAEMGRFKLGSTTVCCFPKGAMDFVKDDGPGKVTRLGKPYGYVTEE
ncbi:archaetidylserine decarboxylase [Thalassotalea maritima]|uniref:archaetidylserine decarboxylase n=1 Tax=Thalassotalea maritima TaxID=3242416 RepID=UPI003528964C